MLLDNFLLDRKAHPQDFALYKVFRNSSAVERVAVNH